MNDYNSFNSTLVQVVATFVGILLASITAYYVFLEDRAMQFRDKIEDQKFEIRDQLRDLGGIKWPQGLAHYIAPESKEGYRSKHPTESRQEFLARLTQDLFFQQPDLADSMEDGKGRNTIKGPWRGRVYFWLLNEANSTFTLNMPDAQIGVFPNSRESFGFERWREEFEKLRGPFQLIVAMQGEMIQDFNQFSAQPEYKDRRLEQHYAPAVATFADTVLRVTEKLKFIDTQTILMEKYSYKESVQSVSLSVLIVTSIVLGIVAPLYFLTLAPGDLSPWVARAFLLGALVFVAASFIQFGFNVFQRPKLERERYTFDRWVLPMAKLMDRQKTNLNNGGMLDLEYFLDALKNEDRESFPEKIIAATKNYVTEGKAYNESADRFNKNAVAALRSSTLFLSAQSKPKINEGKHFTLYPFHFLLDNDKWLTFLSHLIDSSNNYINVEIFMPSWSRVELVIPMDAFAKDTGPLVNSLESIRASLKSSEQASQLLKDRILVEAAMKRLQDVLNTAKFSK